MHRPYIYSSKGFWQMYIPGKLTPQSRSSIFHCPQERPASSSESPGGNHEADPCHQQLDSPVPSSHGQNRAACGLCDYHLSLSSVNLRLIRVACLSNPLIFIADWRFMARRHLSLFIHSPVDGYLGCFQIQAATNRAVVNIDAQAFV